MVQYITAFIYALGALVCHQIPERSFHLGSVQLPVCARCTGLYVGGIVGLAAWLLVRQRLRATTARYAIVIGALPTLVTVGTAMLGWWDPNNVWRALSAAPLGVTVGVVVAAVLSGHLR